MRSDYQNSMWLAKRLTARRSPFAPQHNTHGHEERPWVLFAIFQLKRRRTGGPDGSPHQRRRAVALANGDKDRRWNSAS
jgi:hypothetical protein